MRVKFRDLWAYILLLATAPTFRGYVGRLVIVGIALILVGLALFAAPAVLKLDPIRSSVPGMLTYGGMFLIATMVLTLSRIRCPSCYRKLGLDIFAVTFRANDPPNGCPFCRASLDQRYP